MATKEPQPEIHLTPEQKAELYRNINAQIRKRTEQNRARLGNYQYPNPSKITSKPVVVPPITEQEMLEKLALFGQPANGVHFEKSRDGLVANGSPFLDPEGQIEIFGFDYLSGDITYLVKSGQNYTIKYTRFGSSQEALTIATATKNKQNWSVKTVTGKKYNGQKLVPVSCGFIIARKGAAFYYKPGSKPVSFAPEKGFHVAFFQNGDIATTGYMLIERDGYSKGGADNLFGKISALGNSLGVNKKEDYKLVNIFTNESYPIDVPMDSKMENYYSDCRKKNKYTNECQNMQRRESLYETSGNKNHGHYYWRINWFNTEIGPVMVANENGLKSLNVMSLTTGKRATIAERTLGINSFETVQDETGKVNIKVKLGFSYKTIEDVVTAYLSKLHQAESSSE